MFGYMLGVVVGLTAGFVISTYTDPAVEAKKVCEQNLPRNQECVMHFLPKESK